MKSDRPGTTLMTLEEALNRYIEEFSRKKSSQAYERDVRLARIIIDRMEPGTLEEMTPLVVGRYRDLRLKEASAITVGKDLELLRDLFRVAMTIWQLPILGNPVNALVEHVSTMGRSGGLAPGERLRLVAACDQYRNPILGLVVRIVLETGLRKNEILLLRCQDVDLSQRVCHVPRIQLNDPRRVPLTKTAVKLFDRAMHLEDRPEDTEWLFYGEPSRFGDRKPYALDRVFKKVLSAARLRRIVFDDLRTEAIGKMREAGLTEGEVAVITGLRGVKISRKSPEYQIDRLLERLDAIWPELDLPTATRDQEIEIPVVESVRKPPSRRTGGAFGQPKKY
ncbi:MAG: site-specific integrase [Magnetococcales bacterium]|nr:site-specific integrase [Magnetococcales bacterium]